MSISGHQILIVSGRVLKQCYLHNNMDADCKCILLYSPLNSCLYVYWILNKYYYCCIIYVWKIIEDLVPNFSKSIICTHSEHRGRYCVVSHVNIGRSGTLAYNSFMWRAIRLFNSCQIFFDVPLLVLSMVSNIHLILI